MVLAVVKVAALPVVFWLPTASTPGRFILAVPLKDTPPMVRAVCRAVAVEALPAKSPVIVELNVLAPVMV